ncbi:hypothetical protein V6N11_039805 [Hibiscus sabdariffa]|uniref:Uncharacterized protein n=1 Tax=Hibiscus sabdariffa TaxID=183260 RepID=A0ABR2RG90_9ROSI
MDDYDFVLGLSFLDRVNALLVPFADCVCILDPRKQCVVSVHRDAKAETKVLTAIQLAKDVPVESNIDLIAVTKEATLEEFEEPTPSKDMRPPELPKGKPPLGKVDETSVFVSKEGPIRVELPEGGPPRSEVVVASNFASSRGLMRFRGNATLSQSREVHLKHELSVFQFNLPTLLGVGSRKPNPTGVGAAKIRRKCKRPFGVLRVHNVFNVELSKSLHGDHEDPSRGKCKLVRGSSYERDVCNVTVQVEVTRRHGPKRAVLMGGQPNPSQALLMGEAVLVGGHQCPIQRWEQAEVPWEFEYRSSQVRSESAMRASLDWVGENVTDREEATETSAHQVAQEVLRKFWACQRDHPTWPNRKD